jgi:hypothetical protein
MVSILILYGFKFVNYRTVNAAANKISQLFRVDKVEISAYVGNRTLKSKIYNKDQLGILINIKIR